MDYEGNIGYQWVIGTSQGDKADYVLGLANIGIGYFIRNVRGRGKTQEVEVATRWLDVYGPVPEYLILATREQSKKLDELLRQRLSIKTDKKVGRDNPESVHQGTSNDIAEIIRNRGLLAAYQEVLARKQNT